MKFVLWISLLSLSTAQAALNMKPGLWSVETKFTSEGKENDPGARMREMMAKMPEAQRKKMNEMMGKDSPIAFGQNGDMQVCYSKKMLENPEQHMGSNARPDQKCESKIISQTSKKFVSEFKCANGSSGNSTWTFETPEKSVGVVNMKTSKGKESQINYKGKFLKADCGNVKPVL